MKRVTKRVLGALASLAVICALAARESAAAADATPSSPSDAGQESPSQNAPRPNALESLVPELADHPYRLDPGVREFNHRLSLSPAYGFFGSDRLYALRVAFYPESWLGYEASLAHNPGHAVHAVLHTFSAIVRRPLTGRIQPYLTGGYGMIVVFPGQAVDAVPVTKNTLTIGGGTEFYIRGDLALRADLRHATVFGKQNGREGIVAYDYLQGTIGLAFYRSIRP